MIETFKATATITGFAVMLFVAGYGLKSVITFIVKRVSEKRKRKADMDFLQAQMCRMVSDIWEYINDKRKEERDNND